MLHGGQWLPDVWGDEKPLEFGVSVPLKISSEKCRNTAKVCNARQVLMEAELCELSEIWELAITSMISGPEQKRAFAVKRRYVTQEATEERGKLHCQAP